MAECSQVEKDFHYATKLDCTRRKFSIGKAAGRNASEPIGSLVNRLEDADPVDVWGRPLFADLENGSGPWNLPG